MEKFVIEGGVPLSGTITPAGNKNGALPILAACLLTDDEVILRNVPRISDVEAMVVLLQSLGRAGASGSAPARCSVDASTVDSTEVDRELAERIRASFLLAGPLLARFGTRPHAAARRRRDRPPPPRSAPRRVPRASAPRSSTSARHRAHRAAAGAAARATS